MLLICVSAIFTLLSSCNKTFKVQPKLVIEGERQAAVPPYCPGLANPCSDPLVLHIFNCSGPLPADITTFKNSSEFASFSTYNQAIVSKIKYSAGKSRNDINPILNAAMKTIHLPVIQTNGDTTGVVIGVPRTVSGVTNYLIFYQNNSQVQRDASGFLLWKSKFRLV